MKITDLLKPEGIKVGASAADQMDAIDQLVFVGDLGTNRGQYNAEIIISTILGYQRGVNRRSRAIVSAGNANAPHSITASVKGLSHSGAGD